ncbi:MAG: hypothetical protein ACXADY_17660 [Candidatus Hodarchaeales archaeon]|jgi:hypothetical protein
MTFEVVLRDTHILGRILDNWKWDGYVVMKPSGITLLYDDSESHLFDLELTTNDSFYDYYNCTGDYVIQLDYNFTTKYYKGKKRQENLKCDFHHLLNICGNEGKLIIKSDTKEKVGQALKGSCFCYNSQQELIGEIKYNLIPSNVYYIGLASMTQFRSLPVHTLDWITEYLGYLYVDLKKNTLDLIESFGDFSLSNIPDEEKIILFPKTSQESILDGNNGLKTVLPTKSTVLNSFTATFSGTPIKYFSKLVEYFPSEPTLIYPLFFPDTNERTPIYLVISLDSRIRIQLFINSKQQSVFRSKSVTQILKFNREIPKLTPDLCELAGWFVEFNVSIPPDSIQRFRECISDRKQDPDNLYSPDFLTKFTTPNEINEQFIDHTTDILPFYELSRLSVNDQGVISVNFHPNDYSKWFFCNYVVFILRS